MGREPLDTPFKDRVRTIIQAEFKYHPAGPNFRLRVLWCFLVVAVDMLAIEAGGGSAETALKKLLSGFDG